MKLLFTVPILLTICITSCSSYAYFRDEIPNGNAVISPCNGTLKWNGVGHLVTEGRGTRNVFGKAFAAAKFKWTESLCKTDSDKDGRTNGEELGDPACVWSKGKTPSRTTGITHPGICEPVDSIECRIKNNYDFCPKPFSCPYISEPHVRQKNVTLQKTLVPAKETTYICQMLELDVSGQKMHLIANKPIIDNENVLHHMILYSCPKGTAYKTGVFDCLMSGLGCNDMIALWGVGTNGNCMNKEAGILLDGTNGNKQYAVLQLHWNNPQRLSTYKDGSGFDLFLTPNLRANNAAVAMYGQNRLQIPPNQLSLLRDQVCPKECSQSYLKSPRKIMAASLHMHTYGTKGRVMIYRNGTFLKDLVPLHTYDYNIPVVIEYETPLDYLPGDEIVTHCYYETTHSKDFVYYGESTQQEMCFTFFTYYPYDVTSTTFQLETCIGWGSLNYCMMRDNRLLASYNFKDCYIGELYVDSLLARNSNLTEICEKSVGEYCDPKCKAMLPEFYSKEACFDPKRARPELNFILSKDAFFFNAAAVTKRLETLNFLSSIESCEAEFAFESGTKAPKPNPTTTASTSTTTASREPQGLTSEQLFIITIVAICVGSLLIIAVMFILALKFKGIICASKSSFQYAL